MTKLIKEAKRFQELAGIKEVKIKSNTPLEGILKEYIKLTLDESLEDYYTNDEQNEIQQYLNTIDKNISSVEELAKRIKQIDDFMTSEIGGEAPGDSYMDTVIEPLIENIFPKLRIPESVIKEILDSLDKLYFEDWDEDEYTIGDSYQIYLDSK